MSKLKNVEQLLDILDKTMIALQEEILATNENQLMIGRLNYFKIKRLLEGLILPTLYFIKRIQEEEIGIMNLDEPGQSSNKKGGEIKI